jgi:hypothetical protein
MSTPTIEKLPDGNVRVTTTDQHGNQISNTMTETQTAAFAYDLITRCLPGSHVANYLTGKSK